MPAASEVSFELERFEWTADDRLEVVGRWNGVRGRRVARPALTIESGGRRRRVSGTHLSDDPWSAAFPWSGGEITGAELELGRTLVVELPPPRRRRRRGGTAEHDLRMQVDELRAVVMHSEAERERLVAELAHNGTASVEAVRAAANAELEGLRAAAAESAAERDRLAEDLAAVRLERDRLAAELPAVSAERDRLGEELAAVRADRATASDAERAAADAELSALRAQRDRLEIELRSHASELSALRAQAAEAESLRAAERELAGLRVAHGSLQAAHEALEDEVERLRRPSDETRPLGLTTQRRVDAARAGASTRVPKATPSPYALWAVRIAAALLVAALGVALVILVSLAT
ncbi:MAG TPA: hypothetical protein VNS09_14715 [Solirubrobacter sp.]|nr:hypothetical protein [Solirubrobacter sp.]